LRAVAASGMIGSMVDGADGATPQFDPLRPAPRSKRIVVIVIGPLLWLAAAVLAVAVLRQTKAIEIGILVTIGSLVVALVALLLLRSGRRREEERYAAGR
jgi:hypothetical protein